MDIEDIKKEIKKKKNKTRKMNKSFNKFIIKLLITTIITLITLIVLKKYEKLQSKFYKYIYEDNIEFMDINNIYNKYFGSIIPSFIKNEPVQKVFKEKITYSKSTKYNDGCILNVTNNYLVPSLESGMVVFIGEKENYGNVIIVQQINGIDVWYGNINKVSVKIYDYIEKGTLLGETKDNKLYLVFKEDGKALNYENYI